MDVPNTDEVLMNFVNAMVSDNYIIDDDEIMNDEEFDDGFNRNTNIFEPDRRYDDVWDNWDDYEMNEEKLGVNVNKANEFLFQDVVTENELVEELKYLEKLKEIKLISARLERARNNSNAEKYFKNRPDLEFDTKWVSAVETPCVKNLAGAFRDYGVQFADNFGDWELMEDENNNVDTNSRSIEDIASFKARAIYEVTGLPCISSSTSFEIEPVPIDNSFSKNPRVLSGYKFNKVGEHIDQLTSVLLPLSEPTRKTRFVSCICFYDGEMEVYDYGVCEVDIYFCNSMRALIPINAAIYEMQKTLKMALGLEYHKWLLKKSIGGEGENYPVGSASLKLRDRVLKEARVLPNDIIDVSLFMDSMVDVDLMDECSAELAQRFLQYKPNKILTVATTGLAIAIPMAKYLQVPVVYARKERNVVMADTYQATYLSKTANQNRELIVSKAHLSPGDRILIVNVFLSSGSSQDALLRIVGDVPDAKVVGIAVLLEKAYESGRQFLSGFNIKIQSMVRVASIKNDIIRIMEEDGYEENENL